MIYFSSLFKQSFPSALLELHINTCTMVLQASIIPSKIDMILTHFQLVVRSINILGISDISFNTIWTHTVLGSLHAQHAKCSFQIDTNISQRIVAIVISTDGESYMSRTVSNKTPPRQTQYIPTVGEAMAPYKQLLQHRSNLHGIAIRRYTYPHTSSDLLWKGLPHFSIGKNEVDILFVCIFLAKQFPE